MTKRCEWCLSEPLYIEYHDKEWGKPLYDEQKLFEFLILEGMQAGLSWITILKRRAVMHEVFYEFDRQKLARLTDRQLAKLLENPKIIRNRLKLKALRQNARSWQVLSKQQDMVEYLWQFVGGEPIVNQYNTQKQIPAQSKESQTMSKQLEKDGFSFVGPTICYAFMQAVGMVNDHITSCDFR